MNLSLREVNSSRGTHVSKMSSLMIPYRVGVAVRSLLPVVMAAVSISCSQSPSTIPNYEEATPTSSLDPDQTEANDSYLLGPMVQLNDIALSKSIPMTVIFSLIFVTGVVGNVCTCIVITRNRYMHTATNYYLFSLAVSDLLLLVLGLPHEIYHLWYPLPYIFGEAFCVIRGLAAETSTNASILLITAFTVERYIAICHPLRSHALSKLSRAVKLVLLIWVMAGLCALPQAIQFGIVYRYTDDGTVIVDSEDCLLKRPLDKAFELCMLFFFAIPMGVISVLYILIGLRLGNREFEFPRTNRSNGRVSELRRTCSSGSFNRFSFFRWSQPSAAPPGGSTKSWRCSSGHSYKYPVTYSRKQSGGERDVECHQVRWQLVQHRHRTSTGNSGKVVVKMLVAVVVAFFVCWAPFHAQRLMAIYASPASPQLVISIYEAITYVSGVLYYVSATINPILYHIMSNKFRTAFKDTIGACFGRGRRPNRGCGVISTSVYNFSQSTVRLRPASDSTGSAVVTLANSDVTNGTNRLGNGDGGCKTSNDRELKTEKQQQQPLVSRSFKKL